MGMEDRDAPAPKKIKIKVNRMALFERRERSMMGMEDMDKEKLMVRSERYASMFISNNSFMIFKSK